MRAILLLCLCCLAAPAHAFGWDGHRIAGLVAEPRLCPAARDEVRTLGGGDGLDELGLWADRVRRTPRWSHSGPWHYMNIDDDAGFDDYETPPEGDILQAIAHFSRQLADTSQPAGRRAEALRFLVHFIVDLHQPLHVGREEDRGGNRIEVTLEATTVTLHRFWDTDVIARAGLSPHGYAARLSALLRAHGDDWAADALRAWAEESRALRPQVYAFDPAAPLGERYVAAAQRITAERLAQAGVRLAATLNAILCTD